jgi:hypothetical protein
MAAPVPTSSGAARTSAAPEDEGPFAAPVPSSTSDRLATVPNHGSLVGQPRRAHLFVETQEPDAFVYVAGRPVGMPNDELVVPCGVKNVRIGTFPLTQWLSPSRVFHLPCHQQVTLWLGPYAALQKGTPRPLTSSEHSQRDDAPSSAGTSNEAR